MAELLAPADDASGWDAELEKRSALGALVLATRTFPVDVVLPASDQLVPSARDVRAARARAASHRVTLHLLRASETNDFHHPTVHHAVQSLKPFELSHELS